MIEIVRRTTARAVAAVAGFVLTLVAALCAPQFAMGAPTAAAGDAKIFKALEDIAGDATLVNFGESSHFLQGLHSFAGRAFRHLAEQKGFRVIVFESAWGVEDALRDFLASDRTELTAEEGFFLNAFNSKETQELLRWIRDFNRRHPRDPIRVAGYQPEQPVTDFEGFWTFAAKSKAFDAAGLKDAVQTCKAGPGLFKGNLEFFRSLYEARRAGKPTFTAEERAACLTGLDRVDAFLVQNRDELVAASSSNAWREARLHLVSFRTYIGTISRVADELALQRGKPEEEVRAESGKAYEAIDKARFEIFQTLRETRYAGKKAFFWMHNWHAAKRSDEIALAGPGAIPEGTISIGTRLAQTYGDELVTIGSVVSCANCMTARRDDELAPKFHAAFDGSAALVDLRKPGSEKFGAGAPASIIQHSDQSYLVLNDPRRQFDAIYYLPESRRVGEKPPAAPQAHYFVKSRLLIDPASGRTIDNGVIEVSAGRILRVDAAKNVRIPDGATVHDFGDRFLIPGLVDVHGHFYTTLSQGHSSNELVARLYLFAGVTSVLSPGSASPEGDVALRQQISSGRLEGPRLYFAGEYLDMAPLQAPWMKAITTEQEATDRIDHWYSRGATAVKVYAGMKGEILRKAIAHAHWLGMKVHGHLSATPWGEAIDMGIDALHHGIFGFPEIEPPGMPPLALGAAVFAPPQLGFDKYYEALANTDLGQPNVRRVLEAAAAAKVVLVPTVTALQPYDRALDRMDEQQPFYSAEGWKRIEDRLAMTRNPHIGSLLKKNLEFVRRAAEAGCLLATGTDMTTLQILPGFSLWREMEFFAEAGLEPMEVLEAATINGAIALGTDDSLGSLAPGKWADFVVLDANPLENISNVRKVHRVVKGGVVYDPADLRTSLMGRVH